jgi:hypothetical protein
MNRTPTSASNRHTPLVLQRRTAIRATLERDPRWSRGGNWNEELLSGSHEFGGVWRIRHGARVADVTVERLVTETGPQIAVGSITIYQWQVGPLDHRSTGALFVDLNPAIESIIADSHAMTIGIWFIGERLPQLRGVVHAGRIFWQRM